MNKKELLEAIEKVKPAITTTSLTEQNNLILFNKKSVSSYNDEILITSIINTKIDGAVPANELITLLQKMKDETIKVVQKDNVLEIIGKTTKAKLKMSTLSFPKTKIPDKWKKLPEEFIKGLNYCKFSLAQEGNILNNLFVTKDNIISSDNYRITQYTLDKELTKKNFLIPSSTINPLVSFKPTSLSIDKLWVFFKNKNDGIFCIRNNGEKYPDIESILNNKVKGIKIKLPDSLKESLLRTKILSDEDIVTGNRIINITIKEGKLICYGECAAGNIYETVDIDYDGKDIKFAVVPDFLSEILNNTNNMTVGDSVLIFKTKNIQCRIQLIK